jgi:rubrerythrin
VNADASTRLEAAIDRDARTAIRCLAAAERATLEGRLNIAKVLRAAALSARTRALALERIAAAETPSCDSFAAVTADTAASRAALTELHGAATGDERNVIETARGASDEFAKILRDSERSLEANRDILESDVAQILWGCEDCGYITKDRADICPSCGSLAGDWVLFAPFYSDTPERISRRTPQSIVEQLEGDPERFRTALAHADEEALRRKPSPDEWCAKEIAGHIVDVAELFCRRLRAVVDPDLPVAAERTILPWALLEGQGYPDMPAAEIIARFDRANSDALALIARLGTPDWRKKAVFAIGKVSVVDLGSWLANHNTAHLKQLTAILKP